MSSNSHSSAYEGSPFVSRSPNDDRAVWERLHELLSLGYDTLVRTPDLRLEVITLANILRGRLFLSADSYFLDLTWEVFSLLPSSLFVFRQTSDKIHDLEPIVREVKSLGDRILKGSVQLSTLKKEHDKADQLSSQLTADSDAAANIRDFFSESIHEQGESPMLRNRLAQAQRLVEHLVDLCGEAIQETDDLAEIIQTQTHRLADLEVQRAELQRDVDFHAHLLVDLRTLETDLKVLTAKIGAYFHFM